MGESFGDYGACLIKTQSNAPEHSAIPNHWKAETPQAPQKPVPNPKSTIRDRQPDALSRSALP
jgi:hypothetical protein